MPQIDHLLNSGLIQEETLFWREGLEQWQPVTNLVALRKPARRWIKWAIAAGLLFILLLLGRLFGPIAREGRREANQHDFTPQAAYWRARDAIRHSGLPPEMLVDFSSFQTAQVRLHPPDGAEVAVRGSLTGPHGKARGAIWNVVLRYDPRLKEWTGLSVKEASASP